MANLTKLADPLQDAFGVFKLSVRTGANTTRTGGEMVLHLGDDLGNIVAKVDAGGVYRELKWLDEGTVLETLQETRYIDNFGEETFGDLTVLKNGDDIGFRAAEGMVDNIDDFARLSKSQKLSYIKDAWKAYYPQIFFERKLFEDMMGHYRYKKSLEWGHTDDIASNFKAIDFYKDFTKIENEIVASKVVSMKTTTTTNVDNWLKSNPIKNNLDNLEVGKGLDNGIEWSGTTIKYSNAEVHIYMKKANITPELETEWLNRLAIERPNIRFEIKALEDYIK